MGRVVDYKPLVRTVRGDAYDVSMLTAGVISLAQPYIQTLIKLDTFNMCCSLYTKKKIKEKGKRTMKSVIHNSGNIFTATL